MSARGFCTKGHRSQYREDFLVGGFCRTAVVPPASGWMVARDPVRPNPSVCVYRPKQARPLTLWRNLDHWTPPRERTRTCAWQITRSMGATKFSQSCEVLYDYMAITPISPAMTTLHL